MRTFPELLDSLCSTPHREVLRFKGRGFSALEVRQVSERLARALLGLGIGKGDRVAVWLPNRPEFVFIEMATALVGAVIVPISTRYQRDELRYILTQSESSLLFLQPEFVERSFVSEFTALCPEIGHSLDWRLCGTSVPSLHAVVSLGGPVPPGYLEWDTLLGIGDSVKESALRDATARVAGEDPVCCIYTGGTTGFPKGALLSHAAVLTTERNVGDIARLGREDRVLYGAPLTSVFGCCNALVASWTHGACLVLLETFDAGVSLDTIERDRCTVIYGVPTMFIMQLDHPRFASTDCSSLRSGLIGGAPTPVDLVHAIRDRMGVRDLLSGYGMTETCAVSTITRIGDDPSIVAETVGRPLPGIEVKIVDLSTGAPVPAGREGEICVRGYNVTLGYFNNPTETKRAVDSDGWLHTGDLGRVRDDGNMQITGRTTDMFITGGFNVHPAEVENVLFSHPGVKQVQVVGVPDARMGEVGMAFVELKAGTRGLADELSSFCAGRIAKYKVPRYFEFVSEFPLTPLGKVQKFRLRDMALNRLRQQKGETS